MIMPGADQIIILRLPMISMYFKAMRVKRKFVPETIKPTAVGWLNPISANNVAVGLSACPVPALTSATYHYST